MKEYINKEILIKFKDNDEIDGILIDFDTMHLSILIDNKLILIPQKNVKYLSFNLVLKQDLNNQSEPTLQKSFTKPVAIKSQKDDRIVFSGIPMPMNEEEALRFSENLDDYGTDSYIDLATSFEEDKMGETVDDSDE